MNWRNLSNPILNQQIMNCHNFVAPDTILICHTYLTCAIRPEEARQYLHEDLPPQSPSTSAASRSTVVTQKRCMCRLNVFPTIVIILSLTTNSTPNLFGRHRLSVILKIALLCDAMYLLLIFQRNVLSESSLEPWRQQSYISFILYRFSMPQLLSYKGFLLLKNHIINTDWSTGVKFFALLASALDEGSLI
jgi:hypothetical protein